MPPEPRTDSDRVSDANAELMRQLKRLQFSLLDMKGDAEINMVLRRIMDINEVRKLLAPNEPQF